MRHSREVKKDFDTKVVEIRRVTRVVAGGKRMRFRALVVIGDRNGRVGIGLRKGADVADAVAKASTAARKTLITVPLTETGTILRRVELKYKAAKIMLKPARSGAGIIAGGPVRAVVSMAGIKNVSSKMLGSSNKVSNVRAAYEALSLLARTVAGMTGKS